MANGQIDFSAYESQETKQAPGTIDFSQYEDAAPKKKGPEFKFAEGAKEAPIDKLLNWFNSKKQAAEDRRLSEAASGKAQTVKPQSLSPGVRRTQEERARRGEPGLPADVALSGMGADVATLLKEGVKPKNLAIAGATVAAPEVMLPYLTYTGAREAARGRQEGEDQPAEVQRRLMGAAQAVGSIAGVEGVRQGKIPTATDRLQGVAPKIQQFRANAAAAKASKAAIAADESITKAIPPSKSNPWTPDDLKAARPFLEDEHATTPITKENAVEQFRDHADTSIGKIETKIAEYVNANPTDTIGGHATPTADVKAALGKNVRKGFVDEGMKALDDYTFADDMTIPEADKLRHQLNADNRNAMKAKNNYDLANMRQTDPAFAAREALSESLRDGVYGKLEQRGIVGVREIRKAEGSLIKLRNAAQAKIYSGEKQVAGTGASALKRGVTQAIGAATGAAVGAPIPIPGSSVVGALVGKEAASAMVPGRLTTNELIARGFEKPQTQGARLPGVPARPQVAGQLGKGATVTPQPGASVQTPAEVQAQAAATKSAQTPSRRLVRDPATGRMKVQYTTKGGGETIYPEKAAPAAPEKVTKQDVADFLKKKRTETNASGESSASQEAINRSKSEKSQGIKRVRIDTRSGREVPLFGVDAVDVKAGPYDVIVKRGPNGEEILETGSKARPYRPKGKT